MKKFVLALSFALALTACASIHNPITTPTLASVESSYGVALSLAVGYRDACAERKIPPSCRPIVVALQTYGAKAQSAVIAARNFVKNNPTISATSALLAAKAAIDDFSAAEATYGVK